jgi:hypothetical protein
MSSGSVIFLCLLPALQLFAQDLPFLNESDLLQPQEIGKKIGWVRVNVDSLFKRVPTGGAYTYYKFSSKWGYSSLLEHAEKLRIEYKKAPGGDGKLLHGQADMYDEEGHLVARDIFKNGFLVKEWDLNSVGTGNKFPGRLNYVAIFKPGKEEMDWELNAYNKKGIHTANAHQFISAKGFELVTDYQKIPAAIFISDAWYRAGRGCFNYYIR